MSSPLPVTVIGLGPMGQAMTRAFLAAGHPVTVWNRTPSRADPLVDAGAALAATAAEAVAASRLVVVSLTDYEAMYDVLAHATAALAGTTIANLSSDTPDRTREAAAWAGEHGASFLTGGVMVPAPMVGTEEAYIYVSGPREVLTTHRATLERIGTLRYLGDDPGLAQLMYQAHLDVFLTALSGLAHATALVGTAGVKASDLVPEVMETLAGVPAMLSTGESVGEQIDARSYPGTLSTAAMMGATAGHILTASESAGIESGLPRAVKAHYDRALADGHGGDNWTSIVEGIRAP